MVLQSAIWSQDSVLLSSPPHVQHHAWVIGRQRARESLDLPSKLQSQALLGQDPTQSILFQCLPDESLGLESYAK